MLRAGRHGHAHLLQHREQALGRERRLGRLVAGAVEADDEAVADQLVRCARPAPMATSLMRAACAGAGHQTAALASRRGDAAIERAQDCGRSVRA